MTTDPKTSQIIQPTRDAMTGLRTGDAYVPLIAPGVPETSQIIQPTRDAMTGLRTGDAYVPLIAPGVPETRKPSIEKLRREALRTILAVEMCIARERVTDPMLDALAAQNSGPSLSEARLALDHVKAQFLGELNAAA